MGSILVWRPYKPDQSRWGPPPWPTVILVHGGEFRYGTPYDGDVEKVATDLQSKGYYVLSVNYRLAPCGSIDGQPSHALFPESGRPPQQTDDIKSFVRAARADFAQVKHVAVVGGSAGASHALFAALDKQPTPGGVYPFWCLNGKDDRPDCVVCLSGAYNFADRTVPDITGKFVKDIENYTNLCQQSDQLTHNGVAISPVSLVKSESEQSFKQAYLINSWGDSMPYRQILDIQCKFQSVGILTTRYQVLTTNTGNHSFHIWLDYDNSTPPKRVRDDVIKFLDDHLKSLP